MSVRLPPDRVVLATCVTYVLFANHWARDSIGALELPFERTDGIYALSARQYNSLTSVYFFPNIFVPILSGILAQRGDVATTYVQFLTLLACGNVMVALSALVASDGTMGAFSLLLFGRLLMGAAYEAVDMLPIGLMAPRFPKSWATLVGIINGANRMGSVLNFVVEPRVLEAWGLRAALLLPSLIGASALPAGLVVRAADRRLRAAEAQAASAAPSDEHDGNGGDGGKGRRSEAGGGGGNGDQGGVVEASPDAAASEGATLRSSLQAVVRIGPIFWLYLLACACVYGAVVPFWFIGAKHIALKYGTPLTDADAMLVFPEGLIALVAPPFGFLIDRWQWSLRTRLHASALALALIPTASLMLAWLPAESVPPLPLVMLLGLGYAFAQNLVWATITLVAPPRLLNLCAGLLGASCNAIPSLLPGLAFNGDGTHDLTWTAVVGVVGVVVYLVAALLEARLLPSLDRAKASAGLRKQADEGRASRTRTRGAVELNELVAAVDTFDPEAWQPVDGLPRADANAPVASP